MLKSTFVNSSCVNEFIVWMAQKLDAGLTHSYISNKSHKSRTFNSIYDAYKQYDWNGKNFSDNKIVLDEFSSDLQRSIEQRNSDLCKAACLRILEWGGEFYEGIKKK